MRQNSPNCLFECRDDDLELFCVLIQLMNRNGDLFYVPYEVNSVRRRKKIGDVSSTECTGQDNDFELIPRVTRTHQKMR